MTTKGSAMPRPLGTWTLPSRNSCEVELREDGFHVFWDELPA
jgi:hypothetical protein